MEVKSYAPFLPDRTYNPFIHDIVEFDKQQVRDLFYRVDSVDVEDPGTGNFYVKALEHEYRHDLNCGLRFFENWTFNFKKQSFSKQTLFVGMDRYMLDDDLWKRNFRFIYFYKCPVTTPAEAKSAEYLHRASIYSGSPLTYNEFHYDETDNGQKVVSYFDNWHENIDPSKRYALIQPVIDQVRAGTMKAFAPGQTTGAMSVGQFNQMLKGVASKSGLQEKPGMEFALFNHVFFEEQWYYNRVNGQIYKEVSAITFAHSNIEESDTYNYNKVIQSYFTIQLKPAL